MSYAIVFSSKTGNTRLLADTLRASLPQNETPTSEHRPRRHWRLRPFTSASGRTRAMPMTPSPPFCRP